MPVKSERKDDWCKECRRGYNRIWESKNREKRKVPRQTKEAAKKSRKKHRLKKYDLTLDQWNKMREDQNFKCFICETHEEKCQQNTLCVDHCHDTGKVRGLLCHTCNRSIGLLNDSVETLEKAILYLKGEL